MNSPLLEVIVERHEFAQQGWRIAYSLRSRSSTPLFLIADDRFPFIRFNAGSKSLEIWLGVSPKSPAELNELINALVLPRTAQLNPGSSMTGSILVKWPAKLSGYWLDESDGPPLPLDPNGFSAVVIQGFGQEPLDGTRVRSIKDLYAWQMTSRSSQFTLKAGHQ
jgi:hypothetical protein